MLAQEIMTQPVISVPEDATLEQVARAMLDHSIGGLIVVDHQGRLAGIVTESDFTEKQQCVPFSTFRAPQLFGRWLGQDGVEKMFSEARQMKVSEIMTRNVVAVKETDLVQEVMLQMLKHDVNRIPVVRDSIPVGIIARHDLLKMMVRDAGRAPAAS
jgi:CBS domain-containing protein